MGIVLRAVQYLSNRSLWWDEASLTVSILERSTTSLLAPLAHGQVAPFGFLLLQKGATQIFGSSEAALRLVPFLAGVASLPLFYMFAKRFVSGWPLVAAVAMFAGSFHVVYYASEAKQYSMDVAVTLALLTAALHERFDPTSIRGAFLLGAVGGFALWFSHAAFFALVATGLYIGAGRLRARPRPRLAPMVVIAVCWLASFAAFYLLTTRNVTPSNRDDVLWLGVVVKMFLYPTGFEPPALTVVAFLLAAAGALFLLKGRDERLALVVAPGLFALVASGAHQYPFAGRLLLFLIPELIVLVALGLGWIWSGRERQIAYGAPLLGALLLAPMYNRTVRALPYRPHDLKPILEHVRDRRQPGDVVYVYWGANNAFSYYRDRLGLAQIDIVLGGAHYAAPAGYAPEFDRLRGRRVWVVFSQVHTRSDGVDEREFLVAHLDSTGRRLDSVASHWAWGYLYDVGQRPPMRASLPP